MLARERWKLDGLMRSVEIAKPKMVVVPGAAR